MFTVIPTLLLFKSPLFECVKLACSSTAVSRFAASFSDQVFNSNYHSFTAPPDFDFVPIHNTEPSSERHLWGPWTTMEPPVGDRRFCLEDYDAIGFDLDNTLALYNLKNLFELEYNCLRDYLVEHKKYKLEAFTTKFNDEDMKFMQRGLIVDAKRGNLLKVDYKGKILKVTHGTEFLQEYQVEHIYGKKLTWEVTNQFVKDFLSTWNGPLSEKMRSFLDYFDVPGALLFAQAVDHLDKENDFEPLESYNVYKDIQDGFIHMYNATHFAEDKGNFFSLLKRNPEKYYEKCQRHVLCWLKELRAKKKILFLLTGSYADYANLTARTCLGEDWKDYFDYIGFFSKKPGFFTGAKRPFLSIKNMKEGDEIPVSELNNSKIFSQGNWEGLMEAMKKSLNKTTIKPVYLGDNFIQDLYTPSQYAKVDTVAVCLEQAAYAPFGKNHDDVNFLRSETWGPYFYIFDGYLGDKVPTIWGNILKHHCKICVPSISYLASEGIDRVYLTFDKDEWGFNVDGIYPTYTR